MFVSKPSELDEDIGSLTPLERKLRLQLRRCDPDLQDPELTIKEYVMERTNSRLTDFVAQKDWRMEAGTAALVNASHLRAEFVLSLLRLNHKVKNDVFILNDGSSIKAEMLVSMELLANGHGVD